MSNTILEALRKLKESDNTNQPNQPINLDYKKGNVFLDKMWELVSPDYKIHRVKRVDYPEKDWGFYVLLDEAEYNDLVAEYPDEKELDDYIMDNIIYQNGCKPFVAELKPTGEVHLVFTPLDTFGAYGLNNTTYDSVEEFANKFLLA